MNAFVCYFSYYFHRKKSPCFVLWLFKTNSKSPRENSSPSTKLEEQNLEELKNLKKEHWSERNIQVHLLF